MKTLHNINSGELERAMNIQSITPGTQNSLAVRVDSIPLETDMNHVYDEGYTEYADGDIANDLFGFQRLEGRWDYNDFATWDAIEKHMKRNPETKRIIDIGTGAGTWPFRLARKFPDVEVVGFDICGRLISTANDIMDHHFPDLKERITFYEADACNIPEPDASFDFSLCLHDVLNHIPDYHSAVKEMARVARQSMTSVHTVYGPISFMSVDPKEVKAHERVGDKLYIQTRQGKEYAFFLHLFDAQEVRAAFERHSTVNELFGADVLVSKNLHELRKMHPDFRLNGEMKPIQQLEYHERSQEPFINYAQHIVVFTDNMQTPQLSYK